MAKNDNYEPDGIEPGGKTQGEQKSEAPEIASASAAPADTQARGAFDIRPKREGAGGANKKMVLGIAAIVLMFLLVLAGIWTLAISQMKTTTKVDESGVKADATLDTDKGSDESMKKAQAETLRQQNEAERRAKVERESHEHDSNKGTGGQPIGGSNPPPPPTKDAPPVVTPAMRKMGAAMVVAPMVQDVASYGAAGSQGKPGSGGGDGKTPNRLVDAQGSGGLTDSGDNSSSKGRGSLSNLSGTTFAPSKAYLAPSRKYLVSHNTYTRCALYTEIVTDHPGLVDCRLTDPLYSADGSTVIADAGDRLTGEQSVSVAQGQASVFTAWNELETQSGVRARINSLGAGPMGASGTDAWIDHHWKDKFLGAAMLSIFQDGMQAIVNTTQKTGSGYTVNNSEQNVESMANKVLDSTINIPDTGHVLAGTVITVIVARDIDFSPVFENR